MSGNLPPFGEWYCNQCGAFFDTEESEMCPLCKQSDVSRNIAWDPVKLPHLQLERAK